MEGDTPQLFNLEATLAESFIVDDNKLLVEEIHIAVKALKTGKCPGPNAFRLETMKKWESGEPRSVDHTRFLQLCSLCWRIYHMGLILQHMKEGVLVLLPKGNNDFVSNPFPCWRPWFVLRKGLSDSVMGSKV
jgi:hypothetical protein